MSTDAGYEDIVSSGKFVKFATVGEAFEGQLVGSEMVNSKFTGKPQIVWTFKKGEDYYKIREHGDLKGTMNMVGVGDTLKITFTGHKDIGKPNKMKTFKVQKKRQ